MRGKIKKTESLILSGKTYLQDHDSYTPKNGDVLLAPYIENKNNFLFTAETYYQSGNKGYFRAYVYDGKNWGHLNQVEVFPNKENHFLKSELAIDTFNLCLESINKLAGTILYRTYRGHYTIHQYIAAPFKGKKGHYKTKL
jgi:hypothetical protein